MDGAKRKSKVVIRVEFLDSPKDQNILGNYLRDSGEAKAKVIAAVSTHLLAFALADDGNTTRQELECAARKSRRELLHQISNLDDYFRIEHQIDLRSDRPGDENISSVANPKNRLPIIAPSPVADEDKDDNFDTNDFSFAN